MSNRELEVQFVLSVEKAITSVNTLIAKVDDLQNAVKSVDLSFNSSQLGKTAKNIEKMGTSISKINQATQKVARNTGISTIILGYNQLKNTIKSVASTMATVVQSSVDYTETLNKFQVAMGDEFENTARKFNNKMAEAYGYSKNLLMDYQSTFKNIMYSLGSIEEETAYKTSETLMQMVADYSSLFNVGTDQAMKKFQSALTGSVMPIRGDSGYDVTIKTLYDKYQQMGGTKKQTDLSQTEKRLLRIIVLMEQIKNSGAMGDLAKTIEQPANQIRVFKEQVKELNVAIGNLFVGTFGKIMPYINGFVMALRAVISALGTLFGISGGASGSADPLQDTSDSAENLSAGLASASSNAKELKKEIMGFDKLNNITPNSSSGSSGGGGGGGIDSTILDALGDYGSIMDDVRMKALDIRDAIMDWLGFEQIIDPITGDISWKLRDGYTNLEKIRDVLFAIVGLFVGAKVGSFIMKLLASLGVIEKSAIFKNVVGFALIISGVVLGFQTIKGILQESEFSMSTFLQGLAAVGMIAAGVALIFGGIPGLIAAIVGAVILLGVEIYQHFDEIKAKFTEIVDNVWNFMSTIGSNIYNSVFKPIIEWFKPIFDNVAKIWSRVIEVVVSIWTKIAEVVGLVLGKFAEIYLKIWEILVALGKAFYTYIMKPVIDVFQKCWTFVKDKFFDPLWNKTKSMREWIWNLFGTIGTNIVDFIGGLLKGAVNGIFWLIESNINGFIRMLNGAIGIINNIPGVNITTVGEISLPRLANGGLVDAGQMFIARESGPELVGNYGNQTAVMNNKQIVQAVSQGVAQAVASVMGEGFGQVTVPVYVGTRKIQEEMYSLNRRENNIRGR